MLENFQGIEVTAIPCLTAAAILLSLLPKAARLVLRQNHLEFVFEVRMRFDKRQERLPLARRKTEREESSEEVKVRRQYGGGRQAGWQSGASRMRRNVTRHARRRDRKEVVGTIC
jgi:hypothetical protein